MAETVNSELVEDNAATHTFSLRQTSDDHKYKAFKATEGTLQCIMTALCYLPPCFVQIAFGPARLNVRDESLHNHGLSIRPDPRERLQRPSS